MQRPSAHGEKAVELLRDPLVDMVILDQLNIVLRYDYLPLADVAAELAETPHAARRGHGA